MSDEYRGGFLQVSSAEVVQFAPVGVGREGGGGVSHGFGDEIWNPHSGKGDLVVWGGIAGRGNGLGWGRLGTVKDGTGCPRLGLGDPHPAEGRGFTQKILPVTRASHPCPENGLGGAGLGRAIDILRKIFPPIRLEK